MQPNVNTPYAIGNKGRWRLFVFLILFICVETTNAAVMDAFRLYYTSGLSQLRFASPNEAVQDFISWCNTYYTGIWTCTLDNGPYYDYARNSWFYDYTQTGVPPNTKVSSYAHWPFGVDAICPAESIQSGAYCYTYPNIPIPSKHCCDKLTSVGNPVHAALGMKLSNEIDFAGIGAFPLRFERTYRSNQRDSIFSSYFTYSLGNGWNHNYERFVSYTATYNLLNPSSVSKFVIIKNILQYEECKNLLCAANEVEK
jgi:hypothetical protein